MQKLNDNGIEWEADHQETDAVPLIDGGTGKPIILRTFEFQIAPNEKVPTNEQLIEAHKSKITMFLWKDELVLIQELKVVKSKDQHHFRIFATCQPRAGSSIIAEPQLIQNVMKSGTNK